MDGLQAYTAFVRAFEAGSFSAVARETGTSQSAVSKQIAALEKSLGLQLFARTTRRLRPTDEALELYRHVRQLLDGVDALRAAGQGPATASGTLRATLPAAFARCCVLPLLPRFLGLHPQVTLDLTLTDQTVDLVEEGMEVAVRIGPLPPTTLLARSLGSVRTLPVATPAYLARHGRPEQPTELARHACIVYRNAPHWRRWEFESEHGRQSVEVRGPLRVDDPEAMYAAVVADLGIALVPDWVVGDDVANGRVEQLLPEHYPIALPLNVVFPRTRFLSQRARSFIDFLDRELRPR